ncbi:ABC transporter permease [Nordella sp. HKS 07]|uniref:ABC transporter permease n=1 Tax=Nordella sp. HKS 07 TaxID=2712222 RepID=UPI0013E133B3|nr:ABC transporter permease [Nordella sp. HKS 07]QIG49340.1 ABC transporter permease [Nordella sp. HKS 07]
MSETTQNAAPPPVRSGIAARLFSGPHSTPVGMALIVIALIILFGVLSPNGAFFRVSNLTTIVLNASVTMLLAVGVTMVLAAGELDLSIGANVVLSSVVAAKTLVALSGSFDEVRMGEYPHLVPALVASIISGILTGAAFGLVNGLLVTRLRINSFIVTLGTLGIGTGLAYVLTNGTNVPFVPRVIQTEFGVKKLFDIVPYPTIIVLTLAFALWFVLRATRFGLHTLAIGSSREAAERAGIRSRRHILMLFVLVGALAGVSSVLDLARFATTNIGGHQTTALAAIAAVVIGGTSLFGGRATIAGSMVASLIPVVLGTGLVILGVPSFYQLIVVGVILIIAVYIDQQRRERLS